MEASSGVESQTHLIELQESDLPELLGTFSSFLGKEGVSTRSRGGFRPVEKVEFSTAPGPVAVKSD